jgi:hypothetical protein
MLPWWGWVLVWTVLLGASAALIGQRAWRVWGSVKGVSREAARASALVAELEARADELRTVEPAPPAVTQSPLRMREEYRAGKAATRAARRARRAEHLPPWARVD